MTKESRTNCKLDGRRCMCPVCKEFFSTVNNFDRHRKGTHGKDRHCVDPASLGMVIGTTNKGTFWKQPLDEKRLLMLKSKKGN